MFTGNTVIKGGLFKLIMIQLVPCRGVPTSKDKCIGLRS